jgi:hypothetical protein
MKQRHVPLVLDLLVVLQLPMIMWIHVPLAKERYAHLLGSLPVRLLAHTCHHVHKSGVLDAEYVFLRKIGNRFYIGNSDVTVDTSHDLYIRDKHFKRMRGLWELLTRKK